MHQFKSIQIDIQIQMNDKTRQKISPITKIQILKRTLEMQSSKTNQFAKTKSLKVNIVKEKAIAELGDIEYR